MVLQTLFRLAAFLASWIWRPKLQRYSHPTDPSWAFVTGSTSGVGLALSSDLCSRGFNVILHGRNLEKLKTVKSQILAKHPDRECEILVLDASNCFSTPEYAISRSAILEVTKDRRVTLLINNVGIGHDLGKDFAAFTAQASSSVDVLLNTNIGFMTHLTQILLPKLAKSAPSLVINVGSLAQLAMPYLVVYSATKAYMSTFTKALDCEMRAEKVDVTVECMVLGDVDTPVHQMKPSLSVLGAEDAARYILDRGGSMGSWGLQPVGAPYWFHGFLNWVCEAQPWWLLRAGFIQNLKAKKTPPKEE